MSRDAACLVSASLGLGVSIDAKVMSASKHTGAKFKITINVDVNEQVTSRWDKIEKRA
jgi:hypothetical protein